MPTTHPQAQRKAISYCKPLLYKLGAGFTNLAPSLAECIHICMFLLYSLIFIFLLLTSFLADAPGLPPESESCRQAEGCRQRDAPEKPTLKTVPAHSSPYGWRDKESSPQEPELHRREAEGCSSSQQALPRQVQSYLQRGQLPHDAASQS